MMNGDMSWSDIQRRENGERIESPAFAPGVDFDPSDPEEVEIVKEASARHGSEKMAHLERENARLRSELARYQEGDDEHPCNDPQCEKCNPGSTRDYEFGGYEGLDMPSYGS